MIKTALYQDCHYIGYEEIPDLPTKFFCWKILKDGSFKEFSFFATDIDIILFGGYDKGTEQNR